MDRESIANVLKLYRKKNNYKVSEVAIFLSEDGKQVAEKTIYGWESGQSIPNAECLIKLCNLYNIRDIQYAFGYCNAKDIIQPTSHEAEVIKKYRINSDMQPAVDKLLGLNGDEKAK